MVRALGQATSGLPCAEAASTLESLLAVELKLSYLSAMTPDRLKGYTDAEVGHDVLASDIKLSLT